MPVEKSAGAIIFIRSHFPEKPLTQKQSAKNSAGLRKDDSEIYYLLLQYHSVSRTQKEYWDLPKGHIEKGEKLEDTVKREVEEETGLTDIQFIKGFKETIRYFFKWGDKNILKFVTFYLAETKTKDVKISEEHIGYKWLPYPGVIKQLTYKNAKDVLQKANEFLLPNVLK